MNTEQLDFALQVKAYVLAEPTKVWMNHFQTKISDVFLDGNIPSYLSKLDCGTVGCIAGTACALKRVPVQEDAACKLLGISCEEGDFLFYFPFGASDLDGTEVYEEEKYALSLTTAGTPEYAAVVAAAIDKCISRNYEG